MNKLKLIILIFQIIFLSLLALDYVDIKIPILKELFRIVYLLFIPGILILGILRLDKLGIVETILYSIGLSCSFIMFVGLFVNTVYPVFGVARPLSTSSLWITIAVITLAFYFLFCVRNGSYTLFSFLNLNLSMFFSPLILSFLLMPFLAIFGAYLVCFYNNNLLLLLLLILLSMTPILYNKIPNRIFPLVIFIISLSLLYHNALSSMYIHGQDLSIEYYFANLVKINSYWNSSLPHSYNSALSITMLCPILSNISEISPTWVLKAIYPLLFALVPLSLYQVYKSQIKNERFAFLSSLFFMFSFSFYVELLQLGKQMIAMLFLSLLMLLMVDKQMNNTRRAMLSIIFVLSLIVSHYGTSYIFLISLCFVYLLMLLGKKSNKITDTAAIATHNFVALSIVFVLAWYMYTAGSSAFVTPVKIANHIVSSISTELFTPTEMSGMYYLVRHLSPSEEILRILYIISIFLIIVGLSDALYQKFWKRGEKVFRMQDEFLIFSLAFMGWLISGIVLPSLTGVGSIGFSRVYFISSAFLAPFCIVGGIKIERILKCIFRKDINNSDAKVISIFLMIFFLFNCSFVSEMIQETVGGDHAISPSISQPRIERSGTIEEKAALYGYIIPEEDAYSAKWLGKYGEMKAMIFVDGFRSVHVLKSYGMMREKLYRVITPIDTTPAHCYVYLRKINYIDNIMCKARYNWWNTSEILPFLEKDNNKIYLNGGSVIYYR